MGTETGRLRDGERGRPGGGRLRGNIGCSPSAPAPNGSILAGSVVAPMRRIGEGGERDGVPLGVRVGAFTASDILQAGRASFSSKGSSFRIRPVRSLDKFISRFLDAAVWVGGCETTLGQRRLRLRGSLLGFFEELEGFSNLSADAGGLEGRGWTVSGRGGGRGAS